MSQARLVIADDHPQVLKKVSQLLEPEFDVVGTVSDGQAILPTVVELQPDVVILDITMPGINGIEAARQLQQADSKAKRIFLTIHENPEFLLESLSTGALGYVVKSHLASDLIPAIHEVLAGRTFISAFPSTEGK